MKHQTFTKIFQTLLIRQVNPHKQFISHNEVIGRNVQEAGIKIYYKGKHWNQSGEQEI